MSSVSKELANRCLKVYFKVQRLKTKVHFYNASAISSTQAGGLHAHLNFWAEYSKQTKCSSEEISVSIGTEPLSF